MVKAEVAVIIPNWNGKKFIAKSLESLLAQTAPTQIIVVDNGSTDGSAAHIKKHFPKVKLIELPTNQGFAGGVNRGLELALAEGYKYVAIFNNDAVARPDWLKQLLGSMRSPKVGIVDSKVLRTDKLTFDSAGLLYSTWGSSWRRGHSEADHGQYDKTEPVFAAAGAACLFRAKMLKQVGLMDERFFAYNEDVDLNWRARLAGWQVAYQPKAVVYHDAGTTSSRIAKNNFTHYHLYRNAVLVYIKNMPGWLFWKYLPLAATGFSGRKLTHLLHGRLGMLIKVELDLFRLLLPVLLSRWQIQRKRQVSPAAIDKLLWHEPSPTQRSYFKSHKK